MYNLPEVTLASISTQHPAITANTSVHSESAASRSTPASPTKRQKAKSKDLSISQDLMGLRGFAGTPTITTTPPSPDGSRILGHDGNVKGVSSSRKSSTTPTYRTTAKTKTKESELFNVTVLELVKLIQAALAIFGMFPLSLPFEDCGTSKFDGLLCDLTVEGIQRWVTEVGEPCVGVEVRNFLSYDLNMCTESWIYCLQPMERIADPVAVAALLSLVLAMRNQLAAIGHNHVCLLYLVFFRPSVTNSMVGRTPRSIP
jgi:hypothetical protein